jgi:uncharacterized protein (TIGR00255 family)
MIKSMTAYARAENQTAPFTVRVEVRSYNSRHLDVALKLTHGFESLEERIKGMIADTVARGRVDIRVRIQDESEAGIGFEVNLPRARAYFGALNALNDSLGLTDPIAIETVLAAGSMVQAVESGKGYGCGMAPIGTVPADGHGRSGCHAAGRRGEYGPGFQTADGRR